MKLPIAAHREIAMNFCTKYEGWHTFANDSITKRTIKSLEKKGLVEVNEFQQFRKAIKNG